MIRTRLVGLATVATLCLFPLAGQANSELTYDAESFGKCHADPIYEQPFVGRTIMGSRVRSVACMDGSTILTTLAGNAKIQVLAKTDGWYKVKTSDGQLGWVGSWLITKTTDAGITEPKLVKVEPTKKSVSFGTVVSQMQTLELKDLYTLKEKLSALINELEKKAAQKKAAAEEKTASNGTITLTAERIDTLVKLNWKLQDMTSSMGFKVVISDHANPVYPGNDYHYLSESSVRSDEWKDLHAGTYFFRVCEYLGGKCGVYSNNVEVKIVE